MPDSKYSRLGQKNLADAVTILVKNGVGPALGLLVDSGVALDRGGYDLWRNEQVDAEEVGASSMKRLVFAFAKLPLADAHS